MIPKNLKTKGVILGSRTLGEADKLLFIYTREHGKIKAIAKGALKTTSKFMGITETLNLCTFELYNGPRQTIVTEVKLEKNYGHLRDNLERITSGMLVAKLADDLLLEADSLPEIFELIQNTLKELSETDTKTLIITTAFLIKLLGILGLLPNFKETESYPITITEKYRKLLNYLKTRPFQLIKKIKLTDEETTSLKDILTQIIENETNKSLKLPL